MVKPGSTQQFTAIAVDRANQKVAKQPVFTWTVSGGGTINPNGLFTAGTTQGGPYTVTASAAIGGAQKNFTASLSVLLLPGDPLPAGKITKLLCLQNSSSSTCMQAGDTASIESRYIGANKIAPLPNEQFPLNGSTFKWTEKTSSTGTWFSDCGSNLSNYAAITIINGMARSVKIGSIHDDHIAVWMDGQRVVSDRTYTTAEKLSPAFQLPAGQKSFIIKHSNVGGQGSLSLRFTDSDGKDISDLQFSLEPPKTQVHQRTEMIVSANKAPFSIHTVGNGLRIDAAGCGNHRVEIFNARGQRTAIFSGIGDVHYVMPMEKQPSGLVVVRIEIDGKRYIQSIAMTSTR